MTYRQITLEERYAIALLRREGWPPAAFARVLGRHRSTIGREPRRNATHHDGWYRSRLVRPQATPPTPRRPRPSLALRDAGGRHSRGVLRSGAGTILLSGTQGSIASFGSPGGIAYSWGLRPGGRDQNLPGCSPL